MTAIVAVTGYPALYSLRLLVSVALPATAIPTIKINLNDQRLTLKLL